MTSERDIARNAEAVRNLAQRLETWGLTDAHKRAEFIALNLLADGYRVVEPPPPPRGPGAAREAIEQALTAAAEAVRDAKIKGGRL